MQSINAWLASLGLSSYAKLFAEHDIDAEVLRDLTDADLEKIGVSLGHRRKILRRIAELAETPEARRQPHVELKKRDSAERRQVTVLYCDLVGSTALSALLDPEDLREVIRAYHAACNGIVALYEGLITRFMGDGILICFGYPAAHEDDAERAVRAGLDIIQKLEQIRVYPELKLRARIGIATGLVVVGDLIGTGPSIERSIVGDTPNLAARLQILAEAGTIVIAASTRRLLGNLFKLRELGRKEIKGLPEAVEVWAVDGLSTSESRFGAARVGDLTTFVGRRNEIRLLLDRKTSAWQGEGQVVLVSGEAGIGKSRLAVQLCECTSREPHIRLRYQCSPYYSNSVLHPFIIELERAADITPEDSASQRLLKLDSFFGTNKRSNSVIVPLFAALLSIPFADGYPPLKLSAAQQRRQTIGALVDRVESLARKQPVLAIFEDVHWADATSLEVLDRIVERVRHLPILMLVTSRSEYEPPWIHLPYVVNLGLARLDGGDVEKMVLELIYGRAMSTEIMDQIVTKTDGIPLFVEELTKAVMEMGILAGGRAIYGSDARLPTLSIPATLRDSLMARLDCLAPANEVAQVGAAIGREFSYTLLAAVMGQHDAVLKPALTRLEDAKLLFRSGEPPEAIYSFKHALVRDAAYESLLKSRRQVLHAHIAETLRDRFPSTAESEPEVVAQHFSQGGLPEPAVVWWRSAAEKAQGRAAYVEAEAHLTRALDLVDRMADGPARQLLHLRVLTAYGNALMASKGFVAPETVAVFAQARELAFQADNATERYPVYYGSWATSYVRGQLTRMKEEAETFRRDVENRPLSLEAAMAYRLCGTNCWFEGDYVSAREHLLKALGLFDRARDADAQLCFGIDIGVTIMLFLALVLWPLGEIDKAQHFAEEALSRALKSGHAHTINYTHFHRFLFDMVRRDFANAIQHARAYHSRVRDQGLQQGLAWGTFVNAWAEWRTGDRELAKETAHRALTLAAEGGLAVYFPILAVLRSEMETEGDSMTAVVQLDRLLADNERTGQHWYDAEIHRRRGELLHRHMTADTSRAEAALNRAKDIARNQHSPAFELRATISLAEVYIATGRRQAAGDLLASAIIPFGGDSVCSEAVDANRLLSLLA